jgi:hypothetical protein
MCVLVIVLVTLVAVAVIGIVLTLYFMSSLVEIEKLDYSNFTDITYCIVKVQFLEKDCSF